MPSNVGPFKYRKKAAAGISPEKWVWEAKNHQASMMREPRDITVTVEPGHYGVFSIGPKQYRVTAFSPDPASGGIGGDAVLSEIGKFDTLDEAIDAAEQWMRRKS